MVSNSEGDQERPPAVGGHIRLNNEALALNRFAEYFGVRRRVLAAPGGGIKQSRDTVEKIVNMAFDSEVTDLSSLAELEDHDLFMQVLAERYAR